MDKKCHIDDDVSSSDCSQEDYVNCSAPEKIFTNVGSGACVGGIRAGGISVETSCTQGLDISGTEDKNVIDRSSKDAEVASISSEVIGPTARTSITSYLSSETGLSPSRKRKERESRGVEGTWSHNAEGNRKHKAESSSSVSSHVIPSGPSQSKGHEKMPLEGRRCKNFTQPLDDVSWKAFPSSIDGTSGETGEFGLVDSVDLSNGEFFVETKGQVKSSIEQDACDCSLTSLDLHSEKTDQSPETSLASLKGVSKDGNLPEHKPEDVSTVNDKSLHVFEFDLNEDLATDGEVCLRQSNTESVSVYQNGGVPEPIAVLAKPGVPVGLPKTPLQFDGELGWRRSAATSAFRPAKTRKSDRNYGNTEKWRQSLSCRGIDLNIAIGVDSLATEPNHLPMDSEDCVEEPSANAGSRQSGKFILDLNLRGESHPKPGILGFDLNDAYSDVQLTSQRGQSYMKHFPVDFARASSTGTSRQLNYPNPRPAYWADMSAMQGLAQVQAQPFLVAVPGPFFPTQQMQAIAPLQSKLAFAPPTPPGFYSGSRISGLSSAVYSPIIIPPLSGQHGATVFPQISRSMLAAHPGSAHPLESAQWLSASGMTNLRPSFVVSSGPTSLENVNHGANVKELLVPGKNILVDERIKSVHQAALPPTSMKSREPKGGWGPCSSTIDRLSRGARIP